MAKACIALGSNLGDRAGHMDLARRALAALPGTMLEAFSTLHETAPVGPGEQGNYLNAAAVLKTQLSPQELIEALQEVEREAGRTAAMREVKWGPRTLDLDLLLYDDRVMDQPGLTVPHPRMHERAFVLGPLAEIAPEVAHPVLKKTVGELLAEIDD